MYLRYSEPKHEKPNDPAFIVQSAFPFRRIYVANNFAEPRVATGVIVKRSIQTAQVLELRLLERSWDVI